MKVYELMSELSDVSAGKEMYIDICLTLSELMSGVQIDRDLYSLRLKISEVDLETGAISTEL